MDWQAYGQKIGLPTTGAMGDYYRPQIEEAMRNEQNRQALLGSQPGFQSGYDLQGGNSMATNVNGANQAAGRQPQSVTAQGMPANPYMPQGSMSQLQSMGQQQWQNIRDKSHAQWAGQPGMAGSDMGMSTNPRTGPNFTQNPYLPAMADDITRRASTQFNQQINPAINRAAVANGGYGGSRQGIAQGLAMSQGMDNIAGQLAGLYGNQFNADRNYGLQSDQLDANIYNMNQNWMNVGQQNQLNTLDRLLGWNQQYGIGNSTNIQNTPLNYWQQFSQGAQGLGGMGGTGTNYLQGNPWLGALGGYQLGKSLWGG